MLASLAILSSLSVHFAFRLIASITLARYSLKIRTILEFMPSYTFWGISRESLPVPKNQSDVMPGYGNFFAVCIEAILGQFG